MDQFENAVIRNMYISQYVASWAHVGGKFDRVGFQWFKKWLESLVIDGEKLTTIEIRRICNFAMNGKLELQEHAKGFMWAYNVNVDEYEIYG